MDFEKILFGHVTVGMFTVFCLGVLALITFIWAKQSEGTKSGYTVKRFMSLTLANITFHIVGSFLVLLLLHEISGILIENFIPQLKGDQTYHLTMSAACGMFGSVLLGYFFEKWAKRRNIVDKEIAHTEHPHLDQKGDIT